MIAGYYLFFFRVGSGTLSQPSAPVLTPCACFCSRRRASVNPLAQKEAAQWRDAELAQLLAQNDEVRDARPPSRPSNVEGEDVGCQGGREGLQREMLLMLRWWEFGWMGGGKLRVAEGGGKQLGERRKERCPVRRWLFGTARCQLLMTELKSSFCHQHRLRGALSTLLRL